MFWKKPKIGVDLGGYTLKVCLLAASGKSCTVWSKEILPERKDAEERIDRRIMSQRIGDLLEEAHTALPQWGKARKLNISLSDAGVSTGYLEFPQLDPEQLSVAISGAAAREIPQNLKEVSLYKIPVAPLSEDPHRQGIFFLSVPHTALQARSELFVQLGYEIDTAEPELMALVRGFHRNAGVNPGEPLLLIDIGFRQTTVVLLRGGHPYYSRTLNMGGGAFTYAVQAAEQLSWAEAETRKRSYQVENPDYRLDPFLQRWANDMKKTLEFVRSKFPALGPRRLVLTGGGAQWDGLAEYLHKHLQLPVQLPSWQKIQPSLKGERGNPALHSISLGLVSR